VEHVIELNAAASTLMGARRMLAEPGEGASVEADAPDAPARGALGQTADAVSFAAVVVAASLVIIAFALAAPFVLVASAIVGAARKEPAAPGGRWRRAEEA